MLPPFRNIVRITDHAEATYMGCTFLTVDGLDAHGDLRLIPRDGYGYRTEVFASRTSIELGIVTIGA